MQPLGNMMVGNQLERISNHHINIPLDMAMRVFPSLTEECGWDHPMFWGLNEKRK